MSDIKLNLTIVAENREDLIYWLNRMIEKITEEPDAVSGRASGGGYMDWELSTPDTESTP
jgi:hypothetical protein